MEAVHEQYAPAGGTARRTQRPRGLLCPSCQLAWRRNGRKPVCVRACKQACKHDVPRIFLEAHASTEKAKEGTRVQQNVVLRAR